jgi:hypothetical protein
MTAPALYRAGSVLAPELKAVKAKKGPPVCRCCEKVYEQASYRQIDCAECAWFIPAPLRRFEGRRGWNNRLSLGKLATIATRQRAVRASTAKARWLVIGPTPQDRRAS